MLDPAAFVSEVAGAFSAQFGGPYFAGRVIDQREVERDAGGDVIPGTGGPVSRDCQVQIDVADYAMKQAARYVEGQMRCLILAASITGTLDTDAVLAVDAGPRAGTRWQVSGIALDAMGTHWAGKAVEA